MESGRWKIGSKKGCVQLPSELDKWSTLTLELRFERQVCSPDKELLLMAKRNIAGLLPNKQILNFQWEANIATSSCVQHAP